MAAWHGEYGVEGEVWTTSGTERNAVELPERYWVQYDEWPRRHPPNPAAALSVLGLRDTWADESRAYPALGFTLELDLSPPRRLERVLVTVPVPPGNATYGFELDEPLDWRSDHDITARARSGDSEFDVSSHRADAVWTMTADGDGSCPWLSTLALSITRPPALVLWERAAITVRSSAADHAALNCEVSLQLRAGRTFA